MNNTYSSLSSPPNPLLPPSVQLHLPPVQILPLFQLPRPLPSVLILLLLTLIHGVTYSGESLRGANDAENIVNKATVINENSFIYSAD